jgi:hypothetical protein
MELVVDRIGCLLNGRIDEKIVTWYKTYNDIPVADDLSDTNNVNIIRADLIDRNKVEIKKSDRLTRSILRHDGEKLAAVINKLVK